MTKLICAWCKKILRVTKGDKASHGICEKCKKDFVTELVAEFKNDPEICLEAFIRQQDEENGIMSFAD